jgi:surface protein
MSLSMDSIEINNGRIVLSDTNINEFVRNYLRLKPTIGDKFCVDLAEYNDDLAEYDDKNIKKGCIDMDIPSMNDWDVSEVTNMNSLFNGLSTFNENISNWNVSKVENMSNMFAGCSEFNQDLRRWDVSKVENMSNMFAGCSKFNQDLSNWNVSKVENMSNMFYHCSSFRNGGTNPLVWMFKPNTLKYIYHIVDNTEIIKITHMDGKAIIDDNITANDDLKLTFTFEKNGGKYRIRNSKYSYSNKRINKTKKKYSRKRKISRRQAWKNKK